MILFLCVISALMCNFFLKKKTNYIHECIKPHSFGQAEAAAPLCLGHPCWLDWWTHSNPTTMPSQPPQQQTTDNSNNTKSTENANENENENENASENENENEKANENESENENEQKKKKKKTTNY